MPSPKTIGLFVLGVVAVMAVIQLAANFGFDLFAVLPRPGATTPEVPTKAGA